jgi:hypothetical protein
MRTGAAAVGRHQAVHAGVSRSRELTHDASLYRADLRAEEPLRKRGAEIRYVVLEGDLKHEYQSSPSTQSRCVERSHQSSLSDVSRKVSAKCDLAHNRRMSKDARKHWCRRWESNPHDPKVTEF